MKNVKWDELKKNPEVAKDGNCLCRAILKISDREQKLYRELGYYIVDNIEAIKWEN